MYRKLTPNLMVKDVGRTLAFYQDILGFEVVMTVPAEDGSFHWALVKMDGVELMFQSTISLSQEIPVLAAAAIGGSLTLYVEVSNVQAIYQKLRSQVEIVQEIHETFYGTKEFAFKDCNGYILAFAEPVSRQNGI